jgi:hypothetical protein
MMIFERLCGAVEQRDQRLCEDTHDDGSARVASIAMSERCVSKNCHESSRSITLVQVGLAVVVGLSFGSQRGGFG